jgi:hypothetical protein
MLRVAVIDGQEVFTDVQTCILLSPMWTAAMLRAA